MKHCKISSHDDLNSDSAVHPEVPSLQSGQLCWKYYGSCLPQPPLQWRRWLRDPGSLTERLVQHSEGNFRVHPVAETWVQAFSPALHTMLGPAVADQRMWSRKVVLMGNEVPWVLAHTLAPVSSLQTPLRQIRVLNNRPLGAFLFSHHNLRRQDLWIARYPNGWARCSRFLLYARPVLVAEYFLPALVEGNSSSV